MQATKKVLSIFVLVYILNLSFFFHSIAFKPAESGWGANKNYSQNFDNIFGKKSPGNTPASSETPAKESGSDDSAKTH